MGPDGIYCSSQDSTAVQVAEQGRVTNPASEESVGTVSVDKKPDNFVNVKDVAPSIIYDIRYCTPHNFIGKPIAGYKGCECLLTTEAADALISIQKDLEPYMLSLKIYDCYRPQQAVDNFVRWAEDLNDATMKPEFYPDVEKKNLFRDDYIAAKSSHSRGSTVDVSIVPLPAPKQEEYAPGQTLKSCKLPKEERFGDGSIDFGTSYDCFDPLSHSESKSMGLRQRVNRLLLRTLMEKHGFKNYYAEWWHFTLKDEPYPDTYFNFPVK